MEMIAEILGVAAFLWAMSLAEKVKRMEKTLRDNNLVTKKSASLKYILKQNIGKTIHIDFIDEHIDTDLLSLNCRIEDVDEEWVLVIYEKSKKEIEKLLRISTISGIKFIEQPSDRKDKI